MNGSAGSAAMSGGCAPCRSGESDGQSATASNAVTTTPATTPTSQRGRFTAATVRHRGADLRQPTGVRRTTTGALPRGTETARAPTAVETGDVEDAGWIVSARA